MAALLPTVAATLLLTLGNVAAQSTSIDFGNPIGGNVIQFQGPPGSAVFACEELIIRWTYVSNDTPPGDLRIWYTNEGVDQPTLPGGLDDSLVRRAVPAPEDIISGLITMEAVANLNSYPWDAVRIPRSGRYKFGGGLSGFQVSDSPEFTVTVNDRSCMIGTTPTPPISEPTPTPSGSNTASSPTGSTTNTIIAPPPEPQSKNNTGTVVGAALGSIFGALIVVLGLAGFMWYRKKKRNETYNSAPKRGGHRKWGGLTSIDDRPAGANHAVPALPYKTPAYNKSRDTLARRMEEDAMEKGSPASEGHDPLDSAPPVPKQNRYSSSALATAILAQQNSGLAQFNHDRSKSLSAKATTSTSATLTPTEDPFSDAAFRARAHRSSSLSVPSTAHPSPRSEIPSLPAASPGSPMLLSSPSPIPSSTTGTRAGHSSTGSAGNSLARSPSGNALASRPARKPVPQYDDTSIEMTPTTSHYPHFSPSPNVSTSNLSVMHGETLASSVDSMTPWLQERAPVASRNIGLAGQGDGPVHYLMPDLPPPQRH